MEKREDKVRVVGKRREAGVRGRVIREWREPGPCSASTGRPWNYTLFPSASVSFLNVYF